jgi:hypothetical protein
LPATRDEAMCIAKLLQAQGLLAKVWLDNGATEGRLKEACRSPRIRQCPN